MLQIVLEHVELPLETLLELNHLNRSIGYVLQFQVFMRGLCGLLYDWLLGLANLVATVLDVMLHLIGLRLHGFLHLNERA